MNVTELVGAPKARAPARRFRGNIRVYLPRFFENSGRLRAVLTTSAPPGLAHSRLESAAPFAACDGARRQSNDDCCMQTRSRRKINAPHHSTGVRRYKLVLKDKTRPSITQNGSHAPPEHPGTHTRTQNDLAGPGSGARYAVVGHPEVDFRPFRSKVPLNLN